MTTTKHVQIGMEEFLTNTILPDFNMDTINPEEIDIRIRVKDPELALKQMAKSFQASINSFFETHFISNNNIESLKTAIEIEKLAIQSGYIVKGHLLKNGELRRIYVHEPNKDDKSENTIQEHFGKILELDVVKTQTYLSTGQMLIGLRGNNFNTGKFIYNSRTNSFGIVTGYYLCNRSIRDRYTLKQVKLQDDNNTEMKTTAWDNSDNIAVFPNEATMKSVVRSVIQDKNEADRIIKALVEFSK